MVICLQVPKELQVCGRYFSKLSALDKTSDVKHFEIHSAERILTDPRTLQLLIAIPNLDSYNFLCSYQLPAERVPAGELFGQNCLIRERCQLWYKFTKSLTKRTVTIIVGYRCYHLYTEYYK
jgi:hypothetical protein